jgi:hypothetical protein
MREAAVMSETDDRALKAPKGVEIGGLGGDSHRRGCKRGLAIESCACQARASQKMSDGFQVEFLTQERRVVLRN